MAARIETADSLRTHGYWAMVRRIIIAACARKGLSGRGIETWAGKQAERQREQFEMRLSRSIMHEENRHAYTS